MKNHLLMFCILIATAQFQFQSELQNIEQLYQQSKTDTHEFQVAVERALDALYVLEEVLRGEC